MNIYLDGLMVLLAAAVAIGVPAWLMRPRKRIPLARLTDLERPLPCELIRGPGIAAYGPFPADPGPLTDGEIAAMGEAVVRDTHALCVARAREVERMIARADELGMVAK